MLNLFWKGAVRPAQKIRVVRGGNKTLVRRVRFFDGAVLHAVYLGSSPLNLSLSPSVLSVYKNSTTIRGSVEAQVSGGRAPYSYVWTITGPASLSNSASAMVTITKGQMSNAHPTAQGSATATVTDADNQSVTATVQYYFEYFDYN